MIDVLTGWEKTMLTTTCGYISPPHWDIPYPNISYPAFRIHLKFALLQSFLEHWLVPLATELFLSTDIDTWTTLGITASGKIHILSHHTIFMTQQLHTSTKDRLYFFFPRQHMSRRQTCAMGTDQKVLWSKWECREQSITVISNRAALLCYSIVAQWERKRQRDRVRQEESGGVKRLPEIIQQNDRNTTKKATQRKQRVWKWVYPFYSSWL